MGPTKCAIPSACSGGRLNSRERADGEPAAAAVARSAEAEHRDVDSDAPTGGLKVELEVVAARNVVLGYPVADGTRNDAEEIG